MRYLLIALLPALSGCCGIAKGAGLIGCW